MKDVNWNEIGEQSKIVRKELFKLLKISKGLPLKNTTKIVKSIDQLDIFRSEAEEKMLKADSSRTTKVFYGERE